MKRLMIPVGAGVLALAGTVALALGPNSNAEWGVDGTAGGVLSVQRAPAAAEDQATGDAPKPRVTTEARTSTPGAEPTVAANATPEPERTNTPVPTKEPTRTVTPVAVETKGPAPLVATLVPTPTLAEAEPVKMEPAAPKTVEPRVAKDEPTKPVVAPLASLAEKVPGSAKEDGLASTSNDRVR